MEARGNPGFLCYQRKDAKKAKVPPAPIQAAPTSHIHPTARNMIHPESMI